MNYIIPLLLLFSTFFSSPEKIFAADCATITSVKSDTNNIATNVPFKCIVEVDSSHAGSSSIACGVSINGQPPENVCPSDEFFGGWQKNRAQFNCILPSTIQNGSSLSLTAFDFKPECGIDTGEKTPLEYTINPSSAPNSSVKDMLRSLLSFVEPANIPTTLEPTPILTTVPPPLAPTDLFSSVQQYSYSAYQKQLIESCKKNISLYKQAETITHVPWYVLAGIHYRENNCIANTSLVSGRPIGTVEPDIGANCSSQYTAPGQPVATAYGCIFKTVLDSAIYAGNHLKSKISAVPTTIESLTMALTRYNGTGNQNCGKTRYTGCPPFYYGEDDTYVMNKFDERHARMYLRYCSDGRLCIDPVIDDRLGAETAARIIMENE